jgi:methanogenic corrinoid protein MtbC1
MTQFETLRKEFAHTLLLFDRVAAHKIFNDAIQIYTPMQLAEQLIGPTLAQIGQGWEEGHVALSQVYMSGRICEELIKDVLLDKNAETKAPPKIAIAVLDDYHTLGKRIIYSALTTAGFNLRDYGAGIQANELVARVRQDGVELLLISTLMLRAALQVEKVAAQLPNTQILVGGAPFLFDELLWQRVGATAMGRNPADALAFVSDVMGKGVQ